MNHLTNHLISQKPNTYNFSILYHVPKQYIDCQKLLKQKQLSSISKEKIKLSTKHKQKFKRPSFIDEQIKPFKLNPAPNKYRENFSTIKRYRSQNTFITRPKQNQNLKKRPTWVQDIEKYQKKYKNPEVGSYDIARSDFSSKKSSFDLRKIRNNLIRISVLDDIEYLSASNPGPGSYNSKVFFNQPRQTFKKKLKQSPLKPKQYIKKHKKKQEKQKKLNCSSLSCCSYSPKYDKTFDSLANSPKKEGTSMKKIEIVKKIGRNASFTSPGPGQHQTINMWASQTFKRQKLIGKLRIFSKTTTSFPTLRVYY